MDGVSVASPTFGVEAEEPKLEGQRSGEGSTTHVIDVPPLAWPISCSFTGASRVHRALHLYVVSLLVFVFNSALSVDLNVVVQKRMRNLNVEWIVCGYLWSSLVA